MNAVLANSASRCSGCGLSVSVVNSRLSVSVTVRPGSCANVRPTSKSSKYSPAMKSLQLSHANLINMNFETNDEHQLIRDAIGKVCSRFPDDYWSACDTGAPIPLGFLQRARHRRLDRHRDSGSLRRQRARHHRSLGRARGSGRFRAAMNGASSVHLSIFGMHPIVRHGSEEMKQRYLPRVANGDLHVAFSRHGAGCRHGYHLDQNRCAPGWRQLHRARTQGVDHQGARLRTGAASRAHRSPRQGRETHAGHDLAVRRNCNARR